MDNIIFLVQWEWGGDGVIVDDTPHNFMKFFNPTIVQQYFLADTEFISRYKFLIYYKCNDNQFPYTSCIGFTYHVNVLELIRRKLGQ